MGKVKGFYEGRRYKLSNVLAGRSTLLTLWALGGGEIYGNLMETGGPRTADRGPWSRGPWTRGPWIVDRGPWSRGPWTVHWKLSWTRGPWIMDRGVVDRGPWTVDHGPWSRRPYQ